MSSNTFISLHNTTGATVSEWNALGDGFTCTLTVTHEDGASLSVVLFAAIPFDIAQRGQEDNDEP